MRLTRRTALLGPLATLLAARLPLRSGAADDPPAPGPAPGPAGGEPLDPEPPELPETEEQRRAFVGRVNAAIDKGAAWLLSTQKDDGSWDPPQPVAPPGKLRPIDVNRYGEQALPLLALAKSGIKANHPAMRQGLKAMSRFLSEARGVSANGQPPGGYHTYAAALVVMLYDALYVDHPAPKPGAPGVAPKPKVRLPAAERTELKEITDWFVATQKEALWRYPGPVGDDEDQSASQYALMALVTAGRLGLDAPPAAYRRAMKRLLAWQQATGPEVPVWMENPAWDASGRYGRWVKAGKARARGFPYLAKGSVTGSMTCAGISSLAIVKDRLDDERLPAAQRLTREERAQLDRALTDGLAWMGSNFDVTKNPGLGASWHYYYLYGMERACSLLGVTLLGRHDWYREGAEYLVRQQQADGSWPVAGAEGHESHLPVRAAFALLFLKRATVPTRFRAPAVTGGPDEAPADGR